MPGKGLLGVESYVVTPYYSAQLPNQSHQNIVHEQNGQPVLIQLSQSLDCLSQNLWGNRVPGEQDQRRDDRILRNKKKAVKVLMFVVAVFTVCWLPFQTYQVLSVIAPDVNQ